MNIIEGFRRFGIVFGLLGLVAGLLVAAIYIFPPVRGGVSEYSRLKRLERDFKIRSFVYKVDAARRAGYSDDEVFEHLAPSEKWDTKAILDAGFSKKDVLSVVNDRPEVPILGLLALVMCPLLGFLIPWGAFINRLGH